MTISKWDDSVDHRDPKWEGGREYQLVCGLEKQSNYRLCSVGENSKKSNRFVPWRVNHRLPPPEEPGDWAWFLNTETHEWEFTQWLGSRWFELTKTLSGEYQGGKNNKGELHPFFGKKRPEQSERMTGDLNHMFGRTGELAPGYGKKRPDLSEINRKRTGEKNPLFGKKHLEETKRKISEAHKGEKNPAFGRKWWVNKEGKIYYGVEPPEPEWQNGRKFKQTEVNK